MSETITVEEWMLNELWTRRLTDGEAKQALTFAKRKLDVRVSNTCYLARNDNRKIFIRDCWDTPFIEYTEEALGSLLKLIEHYVFTWLVNQLHSRS